MSPDCRSFFSQFPPSLQTLVSQFLKSGCELYFVGGVVRDYLLTGNLSSDLDVEVHHPEHFSLQRFFLEHQLSVENLSFGISRLKADRFNLEFSPPRKEIYQREAFPWGHSDFKVEIFPTLTIAESFLRRDLTINSMAFKISSKGEEFVDPFHGEDSLISRTLVHCGPDFACDPVRLLRLIRFSLQLQFEFSKEVRLEFSKFNLSKLTTYYFVEELFKVNFTRGFYLFSSLLTEHQIVPPTFWPKLQVLCREEISSSLQTKEIKGPQELLVSLLGKLEKAEWFQFGQFFQIKHRWLNLWGKYYQGRKMPLGFFESYPDEERFKKLLDC